MHQAPTSAEGAASQRLAPSLVALFAIGAGLSAAGLYYNQPILGAMAADLGATPGQIGFVPMLTQLGYAAGLLLFAPLGDRLDRRRVIVAKLAALRRRADARGLASSVALLAAASLAIGLLATTAQDFVPAAAALAPPAARGKTVGSVMTGLLLGILLSRVASGAIGDRFGWRAVFFGAAATIAALAVVSAARLPTFAPSATASYGALLRSIAALARDIAPLRRAALVQAPSASPSAASGRRWRWRSRRRPTTSGAPPRACSGSRAPRGRRRAARRRRRRQARPGTVIRVGAVLVIASFVLMALLPGSLAVMIAGTVAFDLGVQACLISHQTIVYGLDPAARSRLNAVLVSAMFLGMSAGAALASQAFVRYGWSGVMTLGAAAATLALVVRSLPERVAAEAVTEA